jgi:hypothetical protein
MHIQSGAGLWYIIRTVFAPVRGRQAFKEKDAVVALFLPAACEPVSIHCEVLQDAQSQRCNDP